MYKYNSDVDMLDRVVSSLSYLTAGWGGLIWMVILYFGHKYPSRFLRFNVYQSIFISFSVFVVSMVYNLLLSILTHIPFIQIIASFIDLVLNRPLLGAYSLLQAIVLFYMCYVVIFSLMGRYPLIYKISDLFLRM